MRFTTKSDSGKNKLVLIQKPNPFEPNQGEWACDTDKTGKIHTFYGEFVDKLAEYEELEESGLLLRLPCKVGDDIYFIPSKANYELNILNEMSENNRVYHQKIKKIAITDSCWYVESDADSYYGLDILHIGASLGITWFLSQKEAEQALTKMESGVNDE
jgi:hypothetical protein